MARTLTELADTTQNDLLSGFVDTLLKTDEWTAALIARAGITDRPAIKFNRKLADITPSYVDCTTSFTTQAMSGGPQTVNLLTMGSQFSVCTVGQNLYSSFTDVLT